MKIALFPGSFDPITIGHVDILHRAEKLFDKIVVGIGKNSSKQFFISLEKRELMLRKCFEGNFKIDIETYDGLTVDFCKSIGANYILRGLRSDADFEFEKNIAQMNREMSAEIETIFLVCNPAFSAVSSTIVKDILRNGGDASKFIPQKVYTML